MFFKLSVLYHMVFCSAVHIPHIICICDCQPGFPRLFPYSVLSATPTHLVPELLDLLRELLAVLRVLPLGRLLALHHLQQVQVLLLELLHLQVETVEAGKTNEARKYNYV